MNASSQQMMTPEESLRAVLAIVDETVPEDTRPTLRALVAEIGTYSDHSYQVPANGLSSYAVLANADRTLRAAAVEQIMLLQRRLDERIPSVVGQGAAAADGMFRYRLTLGLGNVVGALTRGQLPLTAAQLTAILRALTGRQVFSYHTLSYPRIIGQVERHVNSTAPTDDLSAALRAFRDDLVVDPYETRTRQALCERIDAMLGAPPPPLVEPGEAWADAIVADLAAMPPEERASWDALVAHALGLKTAVPSDRWGRGVSALLAAMSAQEVSRRLTAWIAPAGRMINQPMGDRRSDLLRGLLWVLHHCDSAATPPLAGDVGAMAYRKVPGIGPRSLKVGNAATQILAATGDNAAIAQLTRLRQSVRNATALGAIDAALAAAAERRGMTIDDVEEIAVPDLGFADGCAAIAVGEWRAEIFRSAGTQLEVAWVDARGKRSKTPPAGARRDHPDGVAAVKRTAAEGTAILGAQRARLEGLLLGRRTWSFDAWRERLIDHPLVSMLARRLIWQFTAGAESRLGIWLDGVLVDHRGRPIENALGPADASWTVVLWHPIASSPEEVLEWRIFLEVREIVQPFKQAHREVYFLTDAERATATYSNRFAAHILRQHQCAALLRERGWLYALQGGFDGGGSVPTLLLPRWNLRAEFWVEPVIEGEQYSEAGISLYLSSDQVRFYRDGADGARPSWYARPEPMELADVPVVVLSEVMRDVDLFVGVTSIGADPTWLEGGNDRHREYWLSFSFGDLSTRALERRSLLERLLPRLRIADRCSIEGASLVVRGNVRTYRIHLGSGNILMDPNSQYLCIVPQRGAGSGADRLFLPFEGDAMLAIIISKAMLLASDDTITDATILRQIRPAD